MITLYLEQGHNSVLGLLLGGHLQLADDDLDLDLVLERGSGNVADVVGKHRKRTWGDRGG